MRQLGFRPGLQANIDLEQRRDGGSFVCAVRRVVMVHPHWDMALIEVEALPPELIPLVLASEEAAPGTEVAAIGYPAFDPRNDTAVQNRVFHGVYNVERIMPGLLNGTLETQSFGHLVAAAAHDISTLGGASGSAVANLSTGTIAATRRTSARSCRAPVWSSCSAPYVSQQTGRSTQVPIHAIERRAGLSFGRLVSLDPLASRTESLALTAAPPLQRFGEIRFI